MITEKQKKFILDNLDILDVYSLESIIEDLIDNMSKDYASKLISNMIEDINDASWCSIEDTY